ncbi:MAG: hypothetical protein WCB46_07925 [Methanoregula sp.]
MYQKTRGFKEPLSFNDRLNPSISVWQGFYRKGTLNYGEGMGISIKPGTIETILVILLEIGFIGLAVHARNTNDIPRMYIAIGSFFIPLIPYAVERLARISFPVGIKFMIPLALFIHTAGGIMDWYWSPVFPLYDKLAHFVSGIAVGLVILVFFLFLDKYGVRFKRSTVLIGIFLIVAILGGFWKIGEVYIDITRNAMFDEGLPDLIGDDICHTLGSIAAVIVSWLYFLTIPEGKGLSFLLRKNKPGNPD